MKDGLTRYDNPGFKSHVPMTVWYVTVGGAFGFHYTFMCPVGSQQVAEDDALRDAATMGAGHPYIIDSYPQCGIGKRAKRTHSRTNNVRKVEV